MAGANDITIIAGIVVFFLIVGLILPFVNAEWASGSQSTNSSVSTLSGDVSNSVKDANSVSAFKVILSVLSMFFWTFGSLPLYLDLLVFLPLRIILALVIARNIWIGGGG